MSLSFEWDANKAKTNLAKHDVSFEEASTVFGDPMSLTIPDPVHSAGEARFIILGYSHEGNCWLSCILNEAIIYQRTAREQKRTQEL